MDDLNPLDNKQADTLNLPDAGTNPQHDTFAGGGAERGQPKAPIAPDELGRYAGFLAKDSQRMAIESDSPGKKADAERYQRIQEVLAGLEPDSSGRPPTGEQLMGRLQKELDKFEGAAGIGLTVEDAAKVAQSLRGQRQALVDTVEFVGRNLPSPEYFRADLLKYDQEANKQTPATSAQLSEYAALFAQEQAALDTSAVMAGNDELAVQHGGRAFMYQEISKILGTAVHSNGSPLSYAETLRYFDKAIEKEEKNMLSQLPDSDKYYDTEARLAELKQAQEFAFNSVPAGEGRDGFQRKFTEQQKRTEQTQANATQAKQEAERKRDQASIDKTREILQGELLIDNILSIGGFEVNAALPKGFHTGINGDRRNNNMVGFSSDTNSRFPQDNELHMQGTSSIYEGGNIDFRTLNALGVHEALVSSPVEKTMYTEKPVKVRGGWREGWKDRTVIRKIPQGRSQPRFGEIVTHANPAYDDEPAVSLRYAVDPYSGTEIRTAKLTMTIILPESVAGELLAQIRDDPKMLHRLVDRAVVGDEKDAANSIGLNKTLWYQGIEGKTARAVRPPYNEWAQASGGKTRLLVTEELIDPSKIDPNKIAESK